MIDAVQIESDDDGFRLVLTGDFVDEARRYLDDPDETELRLRLPQDAALMLLAVTAREIGPWAAEGMAVQREFDAAQGQEDEALDPDDPKSAGYAERMRERADDDRKRDREGS